MKAEFPHSTLLDNSDLFGSVTQAEISHFLAASQPRQLARGELLWDEGEVATSLFLVQQGQLEACYQHPQHQTEVVIEPYLPGTLVGESYLWEAFERPLVVRASESTTLLELSKEALFENQLLFPTILSIFMALFD